MKRIQIKEAEPGMIVARPVLDGEGRTLVKAETELSKVWIGRLEVRGITELYIQESGDATIAPPVVSATSASTAGTDDVNERVDTEMLQRMELWLDRMVHGIEDPRLRETLHGGARAYLEARNWKEEIQL